MNIRNLRRYIFSAISLFLVIVVFPQTVSAETIHNLGFGPSDGARVEQFIKNAGFPNSPIIGKGNYVIQLAKEYDLDPLLLAIMQNESRYCTDDGVVSPGGSNPDNYNCGGIKWAAATGTPNVNLARWHARAQTEAMGLNSTFTFVPSVEDGLGLFFNYIGVHSRYKGKSLAAMYEIYNPCDDPNRTDQSCGAGEAALILQRLQQYAGSPSTGPNAYVGTGTGGSGTATPGGNSGTATACWITKVGDAPEPRPALPPVCTQSSGGSGAPTDPSSCPIPNGKVTCGTQSTPINGCGHCGIGYPSGRPATPTTPATGTCIYPGTAYGIDIDGNAGDPIYLPKVNGHIVQWTWIYNNVPTGESIQGYSGVDTVTQEAYYLQFHHTQGGSGNKNGAQPSGAQGGVIFYDHVHVQIATGSTLNNEAWLDAAKYFCGGGN